jgi:rhodanese-related sulfurtransferase
MARTTIDDLLAAARARLERLEPEVAAQAAADGDAILIDIRSETQRAQDGMIAGAVWHPRNVLEWRVDPASSHADPLLSRDLGARLVLVCHEGYQSSLAAATLQDLGFARATDLAGGFQAWRAAGLPVLPAARAPAGVVRSGTSCTGAAAHTGVNPRIGPAARPSASGTSTCEAVPL